MKEIHFNTSRGTGRGDRKNSIAPLFVIAVVIAALLAYGEFDKKKKNEMFHNMTEHQVSNPWSAVQSIKNIATNDECTNNFSTSNDENEKVPCPNYYCMQRRSKPIDADLIAPSCPLCDNTCYTTKTKANAYINKQADIYDIRHSNGNTNSVEGYADDNGYVDDKCAVCHGSGKCSACAGHGRILLEDYSYGFYESPCGICHQSGRCQTCYGKGKRL